MKNQFFRYTRRYRIENDVYEDNYCRIPKEKFPNGEIRVGQVFETEFGTMKVIEVYKRTSMKVGKFIAEPLSKNQRGEE